MVFSSRGRGLGLLAHTGTSLEDYSARQSEIRSQNQALAEAINLVQEGPQLPPAEGPNQSEYSTPGATSNGANGPKSQDKTEALLATLTQSIANLTAVIQAQREDQGDLTTSAKGKSIGAATSKGRENPPQSILRGSDRFVQENPTSIPPGENIQDKREELLHELTQQVSHSPANKEQTSNGRAGLLESLQVDARVLGKDPSTGDKNKAYNIRLNDSRGLTKGLSPSHLSMEGAAMFTEGLSDITAFPRGEGTSDITEGSMMLNVLNTLVSNQRGGSGGQMDTAFKSSKRNVLATIKSFDKLHELVMTFSEDMDDLTNAMMGRFTDILISNMGIDEEEARILISVSPLYRIGVRTCELWVALLNTLISTNHRGGWESCDRDLAYHAGKMSKIREMYSTRIQVLTAIYAYLRDGMTCNFRPQKLLAQQIDALQSVFSLKLADTSQMHKEQEHPDYCKHCGTVLHSVDVRCPWKNKTSAVAKTEAAKVLAQMASPEKSSEKTENTS
jgi:hypothetical protein